MTDEKSDEKTDAIGDWVEKKVTSMEVLRFRKNVILALALLVAVVLAFWVGSEFAADFIILNAIEWLRVSTAGSAVLVIGIVTSILYIDRRIDKIIDGYIVILRKKLNKD